MIRSLFSVVAFFVLFSLGAQTPAVWQDFLDAKESGTKSILLDYSYAGYDFSRSEIPDVSSWTYFDVTDYGATPNDESYDDAGIQAAIDAAEASSGPAVVFFPEGKFIVSADNNTSNFISVGRSNIVIKGSGSGEGGTEIFMDKMRVSNGHWQFEIAPTTIGTGGITQITEAVERGDFSVFVDNASELSVGQVIYISHQSEEFARAHFGDLQLSSEWSRLFGSSGGMIVYELHVIKVIEGNKVTFENPVQTDLPKLTKPFNIREIRTISKVGVEDILFTSDWENYGEEFVHHKDDIHDYGWNAVQFEYVQNAWMRNCEFRSWNQVVDVRQSISVTIENVKLSGKKGHASFLTRRSFGVLVKDCIDEANHHHGPGSGYAGVNTVYLRCTMNQNQSVDSHSGQPYATLIDDVEGGVFNKNGGPHESYPHHARDYVFWNFRHNASDFIHYNFWSMSRTGNTYAEPFFIGFQSNAEVGFQNEGLNQMPDTMVEPRSLFDAQLALRLEAENTVPEVAFVKPESGSSLSKGANIQVEVSVSDKDGSISVVDLYLGENKLRSITTAPFVWGEVEATDPMLYDLAAGKHTLRAVATDNDGNKGSSVISVTIGDFPTVSISSPTQNQMVEENHVEVEVSASDSDGSIARVELYIDESFVGSRESSPFVWGVDSATDPLLYNLETGSHTLKAIGVDDDGLTTTDIISFVINQPPNISFTLPEVDAFFKEGDNVQVKIDAFDVDGTIVDVKLYMNKSLVRAESNAPYTWGLEESLDPELFNMTRGEYNFLAVARDNRNSITVDSLLVIVGSSLQLAKEGVGLSAHPNPFIDQITIQLFDGDISTVELVDIQGRRFEYDMKSVGSTLTITPARPLMSGLYFLQYQDDSRAKTIKVLKQ
ncbi:MAG: DUF4955 domain-containing protein [Cyclobacteriaceae bacterium]